MKKNEFLKAWEMETENLKEYFLARYFKCPTEVFWVADIVGEILCVNDYYFGIDSIVDHIRYDCSSEQMFRHYDHTIEATEKNETILDIKNWLRLNG